MMVLVLTIAFTAVAAALGVGGWIASVARHKPWKFLPARRGAVPLEGMPLLRID